LLIIFKLKGGKQKFQQRINGQTMGKRLQKENFKFFNIGGPTSHGYARRSGDWEGSGGRTFRNKMAARASSHVHWLILFN